MVYKELIPRDITVGPQMGPTFPSTQKNRRRRKKIHTEIAWFQTVQTKEYNIGGRVGIDPKGYHMPETL